MDPKFKLGDIICPREYMQAEHIVIGIKADKYVLLVLKVGNIRVIELLEESVVNISTVDSSGIFKRIASKAEQVLYVPNAVLSPRT